MRVSILIFILLISLTSQGQKTLLDIRVNLSDQNLMAIPDSVFDMVDITYLNLGCTGITFYPTGSALGDSNGNHITDLTEKIGNLKNLRTLIVNFNRLSSLPNSFTSLQNLEMLDLSLNQDLDLLKELDKIKQLKKLKVLKIVDLGVTDEMLNEIKKALSPNLKIIVSVADYIKDFN